MKNGRMPQCISCTDNQDRTAEFLNLPFLNISSPISITPHLTDSDVDLHMPTEINFNHQALKGSEHCIAT